MPRFFFSIRSAIHSANDLEGELFSNLAAARAEAVLAAREIMKELVWSGTHPDGYSIEIADDQGTILDVVNFMETLTREST
jgi:hypothetical protein